VVDIDVGLITKDYHEVKVEGGFRVFADQVVLATHLPILDRSGHFGILTASRSHCVLFQLSKPMLDGMYICAEEPLKSLRIVGSDRTQLLVSGQPMPQGKDVNTNEYYAEIEEWTRKHFPVQEVTGKWSAMDYYSGDYLPYMGLLHRGNNSIYTATGFCKWGLTNGIAAAKIVRDTIGGKTDNPYADIVDARRWDLTKTLGGILEESMHVTKHMFGDKMKALVAPPIESLKRGEGKIVKAKSGTVGAYLDDQGKCHAVNPVCTHLGCNLNFNQGDLCWDCPCHGSRFDLEGEVIHGPAVKKLDKVNLEW
jgi:Rieske Fe-S protein